MMETEMLRAALDANTAAVNELKAVFSAVIEFVPSLLVLSVAGLGVLFGRFAGGAVS